MSSHRKKQSAKLPMSAYVQRILECRHDKRVTLIFSLQENQLPGETEERLIKLWVLPSSYEKQLGDYGYKSDVLYPLAEQEVAIIRASNAFKHFLSVYEKDCVGIFIQEMSFIIALYRVIAARPTKNELKSAAGRTLKQIKKQLSALDECLARAQGKPEWFHIQDFMIKAYQDEKEAHGHDRTVKVAAEHFFTTARWMNLACNRIDTVPDSLFNDYSARGRAEENRDKAIVALASSYELCFNHQPTGSTKSNKPSFYHCVTIFLERIGDFHREDGKEELAEGTVEHLVKQTVRTYKTVRKNRIQEWMGRTFAENLAKKPPFLAL